MVRDREREKRVGSYRGESGLGQRCWTSEDAVAAGASWLFPYLLGLLILKFLRIDVYPTSVCADTVVASPMPTSPITAVTVLQDKLQPTARVQRLCAGGV